MYNEAGRADRPERVTAGKVFAVKAFVVMHRRYLSCTISRCAELPASTNSSKTFRKLHPTYIKPVARNKDKKPQRFEKPQLFDSNHRLQNVNPPDPESKPTREREISKNSFKIAQATSYKLLRDVAFSETVVEGARGGQVLTSMVERAQARAMVLNEPKTSDTPYLGLSDDVFQDVSFAPGTFVEARRFVFTF